MEAKKAVIGEEQSVQPLVMDGYLTKRHNKTWERYWFVLKARTLYYYNSQQDQVPAGGITLDMVTKCTVKGEKENDGNIHFTLNTSEHEYLMYAHCMAAASQWIDCIESVILSLNEDNQVEDEQKMILQPGKLRIEAKLFEGKPDESKNKRILVLLLICYVFLFIVTLGLVNVALIVVGFCIVCWVTYRGPRDLLTIYFNNDNETLETETFGDIEYSQLRIAAVFEQATNDLFVGIYAQNVLPPQPTALTKTYLPLGPEDPIYRIILKNGNVTTVQEPFQRIVNFTNLPNEEPSLAWAQLQNLIIAME